MNSASIITLVIGVVIVFAVLGGLYTTFTDSVDAMNDTLAAQGTTTTATRTLLNMLKWILPLGLVVGILYMIMRKSGLGGGGWG